MKQPFLISSLALLVACGGDPDSRAGGSGGAGTGGTGTGGTSTGGTGSGGTGGSKAVSYAIVAADTLAESAARYRDFRAASGERVDLVLLSEVTGGTTDVEQARTRIRDHVAKLYAARDPAIGLSLLILGDATYTWNGETDSVPTGSHLFVAENQEVTSDDVYADMDGDDIPELPVGRITAKSDADVDRVRAKVTAYEQSYEVGPWNRRINVFASTPGMGPAYDALIESLAFEIAESAPYTYDLTMTYAKQTSPYVYVPEKFSDKVYSRINEGALMVTYVGHGSTGNFATLEWNGKPYFILDKSELGQLAVAHRPPILTLVACLTGAFDKGQSLSESLLELEGGPPAILSSTEESHPVANAGFIYELSQTLTGERPATLGAAFVRAKERLLKNADPLRQKINALSTVVLSASELDELHHAHLHMYTLFGDPGMRLAYPRNDAELTAPASASSGAELEVTAKFPGLSAGSATLSLETERSVIAGAIAPVPADGAPDRDAVILKNYETANDKVVTKKVVAHEGELSTQLAVPLGLPSGKYWLKVYADDGVHDSFAAVAVTVK